MTSIYIEYVTPDSVEINIFDPNSWHSTYNSWENLIKGTARRLQDDSHEIVVDHMVDGQVVEYARLVKMEKTILTEETTREKSVQTDYFILGEFGVMPDAVKQAMLARVSGEDPEVVIDESAADNTPQTPSSDDGDPGDETNL